jgi:D-alanyl-D-alanine carboxypeptidase (penicillin-binding protein 5/6)
VRRRRPAGRLLAAAVLGALCATGPAATVEAATSPPTPTLPVPAATVRPELSVGGPMLASMGVVTDLPPGVPPPPQMRDVSWLLADADTGQVIAAKAAHARLGPASTLKTLTALVLLPRVAAGRSYTADQSDASAGGTRIGLVPGLQYTGRQLFEALLMGSANDAAYLLARANGGLTRTVSDMNAEALRLGALDTVAGDPAGLDTPGQVSSAYDLALFGRAALQNKAFRTYSTTLSVPFPGLPVARPTTTTSGTATTGSTRPTSKAPTRPTPAAPRLRDASGALRLSYDLSNHNRLLWNYPGTIGVKNGWTDLALRTFIGAARRGGHTYIVTEMHGLESGASWRPTAALLDWAFAHGARARPVGHLVVPGEQLPTITPNPTATEPTSAPAHAPPSAAGFRAQAAGPFPHTGSVAGRDDVVVLAGTFGLLCSAALASVTWLRRSRRRAARHHTG